MVFSTVVANLKPTELREFRRYINEPPSYNLTPFGRRVNHLIERYIICSTSKLDVNSAMNQLFQFSRQSDLLSYTIAWQVPLRRPAGFQESYKLRQDNSYVFVRTAETASCVSRNSKLGKRQRKATADARCSQNSRIVLNWSDIQNRGSR